VAVLEAKKVKLPDFTDRDIESYFDNHLFDDITKLDNIKSIFDQYGITGNAAEQA
jgi:hypothetical protein